MRVPRLNLAKLRKPGLPRTLKGIFTLLRLLPSVNRAGTIAGAAGIVLAAGLPIAGAVATGLLIGAIPGALAAGFSSAAGQHLFTLLAVVGGLVLAQQIVSPLVK